ncbi:AAA family ATPase [Algicella marina]|uniref:AAA family ATPase n=1 Tax=Algicella marina TaxID=2683284 RepID=A0A6P1SYP5_9RHOB|nr:AAA family ATPase [Algicella marina]QHQ34493.1 AAA family ATPase [Algicella marina]
MLTTLAISGYRSIRDLRLPLERLNIVTGPNGSGKSSFYKALRLLCDVAQGAAIPAIAAEGGLQSTLWAGPEEISRAMKSGEVPVQGTLRKGPVALRLGFATDDYGYAIDLGLPRPSSTSLFSQDPEIKAEAVWAGQALSRRTEFASRVGPAVTALALSGRREAVISDLAPYESMMTHAADPKSLPELLTLRERMRSWRFYDHLRTDMEAPARQPRLGTRTPVLAGDGGDLAAALQTIIEIGDTRALASIIDEAFPGSQVRISESAGLMEVEMHQPGLLRPLRARELSDGTLRFLLLTAALMTPRPPELMVLNEPETSLHPSLLAPLARLIVAASARSQIITVSHAAPLVEALAEAEDATLIALSKPHGETEVIGNDPPQWQWPER